MMNEHVTRQQLESFRNGSLSLEAMAAVGRHLRDCASCTAEVVSEHRPRIEECRELLQQTDDAMWHVTPEDLAAYVDRTVDPNVADTIEHHLELCEICRVDLADLRQVAAPRTQRQFWLAAAAVAAGVVAGVSWLLVPRSEPPPPDVVRHEPRPAPVPAVRNATVSYARAEWAAAVAQARTSGRLEVGQVGARIRRPRAALRGEGTSSAPLEVLTPVGEAVAVTRPTFHWRGKRGATYVVHVYERDEKVFESTPVERTSWQAPRALPHGHTYAWQVEERRADGSSAWAPVPPNGPALFEIAAPADRAAIEEAARKHPDDHLLLAVLYARAGALTPARESLERYIASTNPPNADSLRASLEATSR